MPRLKDLGVDTMVLSGDKREAAESVAATVGIVNEACAQGELRPNDKATVVSSLRQDGFVVAMVSTRTQ